MIQIILEDKSKSLHHLANTLSKRAITTASTRAINDALKRAATNYRREVTKEYNLKYRDTSGFSITSRATYSNPEGKISAYVSPISFSRFNPTFTKGNTTYSIRATKQVRKKTGRQVLTQLARKATKKERGISGVSLEIKKGQKKYIPFAFMVNADKPGISSQIWARGQYAGNKFQTSKARMPITPLKTASPFGMLTNEAIQKHTETLAVNAMQKEFARQVDLLLRKVKK